MLLKEFFRNRSLLLMRFKNANAPFFNNIVIHYMSKKA